MAIPYFTANPDVEAAYKQETYGLTPEQFAAAHYNLYGATEQRAQPTASAAAPTPNQGLAESATMPGGLLDQYKAALTPEQYQQLIAPLMFTANDSFGGKLQDYQVQLITPLDTSKINKPKQVDANTAGVQEQRGYGGDSGEGELLGYKSATPTMVNGIPVFANYDASGKLTGYEGDNRVTTWTDANNRLIGNWDASGKAAPISSASQTGLFNSGFHWADIRDNLEAAAVVAGNYFLPGSSLLTSKLVTKGAQENLNTETGRLANFAAGAAGGYQGNVSNYGAAAEAAGLTGSAATGAEAAATGASTAGAASSSVSADVLAAANATSDPIAALNAINGYTYSDINYLSSLSGMTPEILAQAAANNALLTPIPTEVIPSGSSTVTPVTAGTVAGTGLTVADVIKTIPLVNTVTTLLNPTKPPTPTTTPTGFDQVPIPTDWRSPTYQTSQTPIDLNSIFTDENLLAGTQFQGLPNQRNVSFNDIFASGQQRTPMGTPVNINQIVSAILGQNTASQKSA
jgi:hypothetical protein